MNKGAKRDEGKKVFINQSMEEIHDLVTCFN